MRRTQTGRAKRPLSSFRTPLARACFFVPATLLLIYFVVVPIAETFFLGFFSPLGAFVGFDNYGEVLSSPDTLDLRDARIPFGTLLNNLLWTSIHLPMSLFTGLFLALILRKVRGASIIKGFLFLGIGSPMIVGGIILRFLYDEKSGVVPRFFGLVGLEGLAIQWMQFPATLLFGLIFGSVWLWAGFSFIVYSAGLTTIPKDYFEAAQIDGASPWRTFRHITWPLLRPMTLVVVTMTVLWELKLFDVVFAATNVQGGVSSAADVLGLQMFRFGFATIPPEYNLAATVATILTFLTLVSSAWLFRRMVLGKSQRRGTLLRSLVRPIVRAIRRRTPS